MNVGHPLVVLRGFYLASLTSWKSFTVPEYLELARSSLELYRCHRLLALERSESESVDDTLMMLKDLIELSAKLLLRNIVAASIVKKLRESLKTLGESEVTRREDY